MLAVAQGQRADALLMRDPAAGNAAEEAQAALLKSFLMLTVHGSFREAISQKTAKDAYAYLVELAPQKSITDVHRAAAVSPFDTHNSAAAYVAAHHLRHDRLLSASAEHYLASSPAFVSDVLQGLPRTAEAHALREIYERLPDDEVDQKTANNLLAAVLRLPPPKRALSGNSRNATAGAATTSGRSRYGRRPGDPSITDYACMIHRMDNHKQGDDKCKLMQSRASAPASHRSSSRIAAAVSAVPASPTGASTMLPTYNALAQHQPLIEAIANSVAAALGAPPGHQYYAPDPYYPAQHPLIVNLLIRLPIPRCRSWTPPRRTILSVTRSTCARCSASSCQCGWLGTRLTQPLPLAMRCFARPAIPSFSHKRFTSQRPRVISSPQGDCQTNSTSLSVETVSSSCGPAPSRQPTSWLPAPSAITFSASTHHRSSRRASPRHPQYRHSHRPPATTAASLRPGASYTRPLHTLTPPR